METQLPVTINSERKAFSKLGRFLEYLSGGDLRSIGRSNSVISKIKTQADFDELFKYLHYQDRIVVMRAADCIEKISAVNPEYLTKHTKEILELSRASVDKELVWHLAQIIPRLDLTGSDLKKGWNVLQQWALDKSGSRIARTNSVEGLFHLARGRRSAMNSLLDIWSKVEQENVPSLNARIKKMQKKLIVQHSKKK
jgi:hypothetical protein